MSKRKRTPRSARSRITQPRTPSPPGRGGPQTRPGAGGRAIWIYGIHAVAAALANPARRVHRALATKQGFEALGQQFADGAAPAYDIEIVERGDIDAACGPDAVHQGVAILSDPLEDIAIEDVIAEDGDTIIMLDQATDPRNIGAVMRSARAFGAAALIVQDRNAPAETGVMAKAASGALEHVPLVRVTNLARALWTLKDAGYWCLGLDGSAETDIGDADATEKRVVVLGAEGAGLRRLTRETCDQLVRIPIDADSESLNLSNAAAIALYVVTRGKA